jgi:hypothetical protein
MGDINTSGLDDKQKAMIEAQEQLADKNFATQMALLGLQQKIHEQEQESMTLSNIEKGKDEAMKAVIQNIK